MNYQKTTSAAILSALFLTSPMLKAEQTVGEMHAQSCGGCHGTEGRLEIDRTFMPLAGMPAEQFLKAMLDFRDKRRPSTLMGSIAAGYSEAELKAMGEYYQNVGVKADETK